MSLEKAIKLCDYCTSSFDPKMEWMWGEGLFGDALLQLDGYLGEERYLNFLNGFCDYWYEHRPKVHSSDTSAPGLITYRLWKDKGNSKAEALTKDVLHYMKNEPRILETLVNHLGHSGYSAWYPQSVWVDSLMMFGVFAGIYGKTEDDGFFTDMAGKQAVCLAKYLQDEKTNLWYHCYWVKLKTHYPMRHIFWGRGNGWVISALPKILDNIGQCPEADEIRKILLETSEALLEKQHSDGSFSTLLGRLGIYKESSATALIAGGWMHAVRKGYLPDRFLEPAIKAYEWADSCVISDGDRILMKRISGPTIPLQVLPWLGYALVPKQSNKSYGMAAYVWASIEMDRLSK